VGWLLVVLVGGMVLFAAFHDVVAKRRGTYRPPEEWEAIRSQRRGEWKHRGPFHRAGGPKPPERQ
jgi:hypothetical protein